MEPYLSIISWQHLLKDKNKILLQLSFLNNMAYLNKVFLVRQLFFGQIFNQLLIFNFSRRLFLLIKIKTEKNIWYSWLFQKAVWKLVKIKLNNWLKNVRKIIVGPKKLGNRFLKEIYFCCPWLLQLGNGSIFLFQLAFKVLDEFQSFKNPVATL